MINTKNAIGKMLGKKVNKPIVRDRGSKNKTLTIKVDFSNAESIKDSEKKKMDMENRGYTLVETKQTGVDKFDLVYKTRDNSTIMFG